MTSNEATIKKYPVGGIENIRAMIRPEMTRVNDLIEKNLHSEVELISQLSHYIINSGGKRLRPVVVLLSAGVFDYQGEQHCTLAAIIEFIHTATLLHDDVVDASSLRRGRLTANRRWGNEASILVGDFVYSRAFQMMVNVDSMRIMNILSETTNAIAEGEVKQLVKRHDTKMSQKDYLEIINNKTAKLFKAGAQLGAVVAMRDEWEEQAMATYGKHLGMAFQLVDDTLDYSASVDELGKNIGDDLAEGKPTLPLLYAMWYGNETDKKIIRDAIEYGGLENINKIREVIHATGAISYTIDLARNEARLATEALASLPQSDYLDALYALARFSVGRQY